MHCDTASLHGTGNDEVRKRERDYIPVCIEHNVSDYGALRVLSEGRAQLCQTALMNAAVLASLEERLIQMAPLGAAAYQAINEAHAIGAMKKIMQW